MNKWAEERTGLLALLRTLFAFANLFIASILTLHIFEYI
jgi:hypothetical protein